ncbi:MAG: hypothetical protein MI976_31865 [Pseudomonadales bacterium]|nr:hypothetical protein [Pseudomonadales bacterium]
MSEQSASSLEKYLQRHENKPNLYRVIYSLAGACLLAGFGIFNVAGYHRATAVGGYYAELGLFVLALLFLFSGAMILAIRKRLRDPDFRSPAHAIVFHFKIVAIPLILSVLFSLDFARFFWVGDSYMELTVKANEQVKKDLKWLLGDLYPEDQEENIDPDTLEWRMVLDEVPDPNYMRVIRTNSPKVTKIQFDFYSDQLNTQKIEVLGLENGREIRHQLQLDWGKAEFYGYNQSDSKHSYPICDLRVPLLSSLPERQSRYRVLINNSFPEDILFDHKGFGFGQAEQLPPMMRIEHSELVVRTNYPGSAWPVYCLYNYPRDQRDYIPEPMTSASLNGLNSSKFKLHFKLFPGLHQSGHIIDYEIHTFVRRSSYDEYFELLDMYVAYLISATRSGVVSRKTY